jgi:catechol 2,3-dioxygenase-like lactoylglutathione lyase family enzyme
MTDVPVLDHVGIQVADYDKAIKFYTAALKPLAWKKMMEFKYDGGSTAGFGARGKPYLWLSTGGKTSPHVHIALGATSRAEVDAFYKAAMKAGGTDNGPPGLRENYHPTYYAAFVTDLDGHNIEAVTHAPPPKAAKAATKKKAPAKRKPAGKK